MSTRLHEFRNRLAKLALGFVLPTAVSACVLSLFVEEARPSAGLPLILAFALLSPLVLALWMRVFSPETREAIRVDDTGLRLQRWDRTTAIAWPHLASIETSGWILKRTRFLGEGAPDIWIDHLAYERDQLQALLAEVHRRLLAARAA